MSATYNIRLTNGDSLIVHEGYMSGGTISIEKDKLAIGYMEHIAVISMTKEDFKELRNTLNKILANEGDNK